MVTLVVDGFEFCFDGVVDVFIFDETNQDNPRYNKAPMKKVDIIVELNDKYFFIEVKDYADRSYCDMSIDDTNSAQRHANFTWLKNCLIKKFRDTLLYRWAEEKVDKPIYYFCLLDFDDALNIKISKELCNNLPIENDFPRLENFPIHWKRPLAHGCQVFNLEKWNEHFPKAQVTRLALTP